jgi:ribosomal protein L37AE/L43A
MAHKSKKDKKEKSGEDLTQTELLTVLVKHFKSHADERSAACDSRGYHRVDQEAEGIMVCYDCNYLFDKHSNIAYQVMPRQSGS